MRKNAERKMVRRFGFGWMAAAAVLGVVAFGGWSGVEAQGCAYQSTWCNGIDFDNVEVNVLGSPIRHGHGDAQRCIFVNGASGILNFNPADGHMVNGQPAGYYTQSQFNALTRVDGGVYVYLNTNGWAEINVTAGAPACVNDPNFRRLNISTTGTGTTNPAAGSHDLPVDSPQAIVAAPGTGMNVEWTGCATVTNGGLTCNVTMSQNRTVTAAFVPLRYALTITTSGTGTATPTPAQPANGYTHGTTVAINATGIAAGDTVMWDGCASVGGTLGRTCTVTMDAAKTVTATFGPPLFTIRAGYLAWNTADGDFITAGTGDWNAGTPGNWSSGNPRTRVAWTQGSSALFAGQATPVRTVTVIPARTVDTMRFVSSGYTIAGTAANALTMNSGRIFVESDRSAVINAALAGTAGLTFAGGGNLTIGGGTVANTYTGATNISAGTLTASKANAFGAAGTAAAVTVAAGATLNLSGGISIPTNRTLTVNNGAYLVSTAGTNTWGGAVTLAGAATTIQANASSPLTITGGVATGTGATSERNIISTGNITLGGAITGSVPIIKAGSGNLILTGNTTAYTGTINVDDGNLQIGGTAGALNGSVALRGVNSGIIFSRSNATAMTHAGVISGSGAGGLRKEGTNALTLTGTNTYTGPTLVTAGTLVSQRVNATTMAIPSGSPITVTGPGTGTVVASLRCTTALAVTFGGNITLTNNNSALEFSNTGAAAVDMAYTGTINGSGTTNVGRISKIGTGTLTLSGANRARSLNIAAGRVNMAYPGTTNAAAVPRLNADTVIVAAGATLGGSPRVTLPAAGLVQVGGTLNDAAAQPLNITGGRVDLFQGTSGGTIILGGGRIDRLDMISTPASPSVMVYDINRPAVEFGTLNPGGTLDVTTPANQLTFDSYTVATYTTVGAGRFSTIRVGGQVVTQYNASGVITSQTEVDGKFFAVEISGGTVRLVIDQIDVTGVDNYLSVTSARFKSPTQVELVVAGMMQAAHYSRSTAPNIDSVGIWYNPGGPVTMVGQAGTALLTKICFDELVSSTDYADMDNGYMESSELGNSPAINTRLVTVTVPVHPNTPAAGVYLPDPFYHFNIKEFWVIPRAPEPYGVIQGNNMLTTGEFAFMRAPSHVVAANSLTIMGEELDFSQNPAIYEVGLSISNYMGLPHTPVSHKPHVDSIGVWMKNGSGGISTPGVWSDVRVGNKFNLQTMKGEDGGVLRYTVNITSSIVDPASDVEDTFYFAVAPRWRRAAFEGASAFDSVASAIALEGGHICTVVIKPNRLGDLPKNPLVLTAVQPDPRNNTVNVTVSDPQDPDNPLYDGAVTIRVRFSFNLAMSPFLHEELITVPLMTGVPVSSNFSLPEMVEFGQEMRNVYWEIAMLNAEGNLITGAGTANRDSFTVGRHRPRALQNFTAVAQSHNRVRLSWNRIQPAVGCFTGPDHSLCADGAYVLIGRSLPASAPSPVNDFLDRNNFGILLSASDASPVGNPLNVTRVNDTTVDITGFGAAGLLLEEETEYWFAGAVMDSVARAGGVWNLISNAEVRTVTTLEDDPSFSVVNILEIKDIHYDRDELNFEVTYSITEPNTEGLKYGYHISVNMNDPTHPVNPAVITATQTTDATFVTRSPGPDMLFDTTWYIILYTFKDPEPGVTGAVGIWSADKVIGSVRVGPFNRQPVVVGRDALNAGYANNNQFRVQGNWNDIVNNANPRFDADVIRSSQGGAIGEDDDFVYVSTGYEFLAKNAVSLQTPLSFSLKAENIPSGYSINDVRLYRWNESGCNNTGCWDVIYDYILNEPQQDWVTGTGLSTAPSAVYRLMIDKQKPRLVFGGVLQDKGFVRLSTLDFETTTGFNEVFDIQKNNVGNFTYTLYYGAANNSGFPARRAAANPAPLSGVGSRVTFTIDGVDIRNMSELPDNSLGLRAFLVINDGRHIDTINVSRSIKYDKYINYIDNSRPNSWVPVAAQAALAEKSLRSLMDPLFSGGEGKDGYDNTKFRIFRWHTNKWVEYGDSSALANERIFSLEPGRLFWLKTANVENMTFETDVTSSSLIDTFTITLARGEWTDFMLPFRFDVRLGDIFDATDNSLSKSLIDQLEIYRWEPQARTYVGRRIFLGGIDDPLSQSVQSDSLRGGNNPFTIRNSGSAPIVLRIPPTLAAMSKYRPGAAPVAKAAAKQQHGNLGTWFYTVNTRVGSAQLGEIMAGYNSIERRYGVPPTLGGESVMLIDGDGRAMGHFLTSDMGNGGRTFKLRFTNSERQRTTFSFSAQPSMFAPGNMEVMFVNAATGELISGGLEYNISVDAFSHEDVYMVLGSKDYLAKTGIGANAKFVMGNIAVNQAARSARIRYYVPFAGVDRVEATAYDLKGNVIWRNTQKAQSASWNTMEWNSRGGRHGGTSAGLYIVRVKALNAKGKPVAVANRRVTFAP